MSSNDSNLSVVLGIDLGTTYSCVSVYNYDNDTVIVIPNDDGYNTTPSVICFEDNQIVIGDVANLKRYISPKNTIYNIKRLLGKNSTDCNINNLTYDVILDHNNNSISIPIKYNNENKYFNPTQLSAFIIKKMKNIAESYLNTSVKDAVITVPAYFTDRQRKETIDAGKLVGLNILKIINEPTAAALAYGIDKKFDSAKILIFDYGGGTFDISILNLSDGLFEVLGTSGNTYLGGEDINTLLTNYCIDKFNKKYKVNLKDNIKAINKIRIECENAKKSLSYSYSTKIIIESIFEDYDLNIDISRSQFENIIKNELDKCIVLVENTLKEINLNKSDIDDIILIGGSTKIPKIKELLSAFFNKEIKNSINPDEAVSIGAAIQCAILSKSTQKSKIITDLVLIDVIPLSLGVEIGDGIMSNLINKNSRTPCFAKKTFTTFRDNQTNVSVKIYEGERIIAHENNLLGILVMDDIELNRRGVPKLEVTFEINTNGILNVFATDLNTNKSKSIKIGNIEHKNNYKLVDDMIENSLINKNIDAKFASNLNYKSQLEETIRIIDATLTTIDICENNKNKYIQIKNYIYKTKNWVDNLYSDNIHKYDTTDFTFKETKLKELYDEITRL